MDTAAADAPEGEARQFGAPAQGPDEQIDLARAALAIGRIEHPGVDLERYAAKIDAMAQAVRARFGPRATPSQQADALNRYLVGELGLRGDQTDYDHPRNSFLHEVMDRRTGLPITLSVLYIEVGRRIGLAVAGVGTPGHFLVKFQEEGRSHFLDPFHGGEEAPEERLRSRLEELAGERPGTVEALPAAVTKRQILSRILGNLKAAYFRRQDFSHAPAVSQHLPALAPWDLDERRERGLLLTRLGRTAEALSELEIYCAYGAEAAERTRIDEVLRRLRSERPGR